MNVHVPKNADIVFIEFNREYSRNTCLKSYRRQPAAYEMT